MKVAVIRASDSRNDPELLWLLALGAVGVAGLAALLLRIPAPGCLFHELTGLPCFTCGGTRCVRSLLAGDPCAALAWNPLVFLALVGCAAFALYASAVVCFRLPRVRFAEISKRQARLMRLSIAFLLVANWIYLIWRGV